MSSLDIRINIRSLTHYSERLKFKIDKETLYTLIEIFSEYMRNVYINRIEEAIYSKRYEGEWEPKREKGYQEYLGTNPIESDILTLIKDALETQKIGYNYMIRFKPYYKYPGSNRTLLNVLRAIDAGTGDFNARPIFKKIIRELNHDILPLWKDYLAMEGII